MGGKAVLMQSLLIDKSITYDGSQLCSHWILKNTQLKGDAIVAFIGPCQVELTQMVDLEDVINKKPIYSELMLHFLVEHFESDLEKAILRQRLLMAQIQEEYRGYLPFAPIVRKGDDLFIENFKLTVSIATTSPVSTLIHAGINISSYKTPVPTRGLKDDHIDPVLFAKGVMKRYVEEIEGIKWARAKVRGVP